MWYFWHRSIPAPVTVPMDVLVMSLGMLRRNISRRFIIIITSRECPTHASPSRCSADSWQRGSDYQEEGSVESQNYVRKRLTKKECFKTFTEDRDYWMSDGNEFQRRDALTRNVQTLCTQKMPSMTRSIVYNGSLHCILKHCCVAFWLLTSAPLKLRPYGTIQIYLLLLLLFF